MRLLVLLLLPFSVQAVDFAGYAGFTASPYDVYASNDGLIYGLVARQEFKGGGVAALVGPDREGKPRLLFGGADIHANRNWRVYLGRPRVSITAYPSDRIEPTTGPGVSIENSPFVAALLESATFINYGMRLNGDWDRWSIEASVFAPAEGLESTAGAQSVTAPQLPIDASTVNELLSVELGPIAQALIGISSTTATQPVRVDRSDKGGSIGFGWFGGTVNINGAALYLNNTDLRIGSASLELVSDTALLGIEALHIVGTNGKVSAASVLGIWRIASGLELAAHANGTTGRIESSDYGLQLRYRRWSGRFVLGYRVLRGTLSVGGDTAELDDSVVEAQAVLRF